MGCTSSKIDTEEAVKRCKARKRYIKQAVAHRHAFAAAHASYVTSLKNTGAAIRQFSDVEVPQEAHTAPVPRTAFLGVPTNLLPPPLPPDSKPSQDAFPLPLTPLSRAASMPPMALKSLGASPLKSSLASRPQAVSEEEEESDQDQGYLQHKATHSERLFSLFDDLTVRETNTSDTEEFDLKAPETETRGCLDEEIEQREEEQYQEQAPMPEVKRVVEEKAGFERETRKQPQMLVPQKTARSGKDLRPILRNIDDLFLASYEAGKEVSRLLEAQRVYYHTPFVDEKHGIKVHRETVSRILSWGKSSPRTPLVSEDIDGTSHDNSIESLASTVDKLHAWEKKLYDEVKAAEATRLELERKSSQLKNQKERREAAATIEKTKALFKSLQTRYLVEIQAVDAANLEVEKLRDGHLYPQLRNLLEALKDMWKVMFECHQKQVSMVAELITFEASPNTKETSDFCKKIIEELEREVTGWRESLEKLVTFQNDWMMVLLEWLLLNVQQSESEVIDNLASSQKVATLCDLCKAWGDALKQMSADKVLQALKGFSTILHDMATKQEDEIKQKKKKDDVHKDLQRKKKALEVFELKYRDRQVSQENQESFSRHPVQERKALVDLLEKNFKEAEERHAKLCVENSTMILRSLQNGLPDVLQSIMDFSDVCAKKYGSLYDRVKAE